MRGSLLFGNPSQGCARLRCAYGGQSGHYAALVRSADTRKLIGWRGVRNAKGCFSRSSSLRDIARPVELTKAARAGTMQSTSATRFLVSSGNGAGVTSPGSFFSANPVQAHAQPAAVMTQVSARRTASRWIRPSDQYSTAHRPNVFDNGVPVGGWAYRTVNPDGSYRFQVTFMILAAPVIRSASFGS